MHSINIRFLYIIPVLLIALFSIACMGPIEKTRAKYPGLSYIEPPEVPVPLLTKDLNSGLAVIYFYYISGTDIGSLPQGENILKMGVPGPPITNLDNRFKNNEIFQSGAASEVGLEMSGYIRLDKKGSYLFKANSNDGFRLYINNNLIIDDPYYHSDTLSPESVFNVLEPAWYPIKIRYFQRKGTATLQLFWKSPGDDKFSIVPAEALAHPRS